MDISLIGTGRMARNLAQGWVKAGHTVKFGSRHPQSKQTSGDEALPAAVASIEAALMTAEVVVIAIPFTAVKAFAEQYSDGLRDKLVIDISNPFEHLPDNRISAPEITAQAIGPEARVVAAFKANIWETLTEPVDLQTQTVRDVHFAGDIPSDKEIVAGLISDLGFRPIDCGPLRNARILDGMVSLIVELDQRYGDGTHRLSWKLLG